MLVNGFCYLSLYRYIVLADLGKLDLARANTPLYSIMQANGILIHGFAEYIRHLAM